MTEILDPTEAWMRREHPERVAARDRPHPFVVMGFDPVVDGPDHVCRASCVCDTCWEPKSRHVHRQAAS